MLFTEEELNKSKPLSLEEYSLISNGQIDFHSTIWYEIVKRFGRPAVQKHLSNLIDGLPFPYRQYNDEELRADFNRLLADNSGFLYGEWLPKRVQQVSDFKYRGGYLYIKGTNNGLKVSDQYTQEQRMKCAFSGGKSPYENWVNKGNVRPLLRPLFTLPGVVLERVNNTTMYNGLRLSSYMASQFKPSVAKTLYDFFNAKNVLDLSAGWGDRLVGFLASSAESYIGIDPNSALHEPYQKIVDFCKAENKRARFICAPAEDVDLSGTSVDFVFTSPPYFDRERYSNEETQSWRRYKSDDEWMEGFLKPSLKKAWDVLVDGGRIAINISDVSISVAEGSYKIVCAPMIEYMNTLGATYEGVIGYRIKKRPNDPIIKDLNVELCEPIFIWSKGHAKAPDWKKDNFFGL